ncbi:MAG: DUF5343 domain-containing protein [Acetobacteraceae bacterium]|nr:DUF5343 domain-containing protein [Acetobacteraceae bacterium]
MADSVYTTVPGKIKTLLAKIKSVGVPPKVTNEWLKLIGFKSSNDSTLISVLKLVGLVDASGVPTDSWQKYRGVNGQTALGEGIRSGYGFLYNVYDDAHMQQNDMLGHVFTASSKAGGQVISKAIATFKALVGEAIFEQRGFTEAMQVDERTMHVPLNTKPLAKSPVGFSSGPSLHIDLQVHVSPEASPDQIDQIFASMAKHLFNSKREHG